MSRRKNLAAVPDRPLRALAYVRVSALMGRGGADFYSPEIQLGEIRNRLIGLHEVAVIEDIDVSGQTFSRAGISRIEEMADDRAFDVLAVMDVSRLGRNLVESLLFLNALADKGITIISAREYVDTSTPHGRLALHQMLAIAQYRGDEIGENWARTIQKRANNGKSHGRSNVGYIKRDKKMVPDPVVGPAMTECFRRWAIDTPTIEVARYLAAARGKQVDTSNLLKWLRDPVYLGFVKLHGELLPGEHEPLVDQDTWDRVQLRMAREHNAPPRAVNPTWSMVGLIKCPRGCALQRSPYKRSGGRLKGLVEQRLVCGRVKWRTAGSPCDGIGTPLLTAVEDAVLDRIAEYIKRLRTDHHEHALRLARQAIAVADVATIQSELEKLKRGQAKLATEWATGGLPDEVYRKSMAGLRDAETGLAQQLAEARSAAATPALLVTSNAAEYLLRRWEDMTPAEQGKALRTVVKKITLRRAAYWREPVRDCVEIEWL